MTENKKKREKHQSSDEESDQEKHKRKKRSKKHKKHDNDVEEAEEQNSRPSKQTLLCEVEFNYETGKNIILRKGLDINDPSVKLNMLSGLASGELDTLFAKKVIASGGHPLLEEYYFKKLMSIPLYDGNKSGRYNPDIGVALAKSEVKRIQHNRRANKYKEKKNPKEDNEEQVEDITDDDMQRIKECLKKSEKTGRFEDLSEDMKQCILDRKKIEIKFSS
jgi:hypothetical protein